MSCLIFSCYFSMRILSSYYCLVSSSFLRSRSACNRLLTRRTSFCFLIFAFFSNSSYSLCFYFNNSYLASVSFYIEDRSRLFFMIRESSNSRRNFVDRISDCLSLSDGRYETEEVALRPLEFCERKSRSEGLGEYSYRI